MASHFAGWPDPAHSVAICEGLEDWGATDLSNISDSDEEDQPGPLVRFFLLNHVNHGCFTVREVIKHFALIK